MSCMWCISFLDTDIEGRADLKGEEYLRRPGQCTLNPQWVPVTGDHFCRSFLQEVSSWGETTSIAQWWLNARRAEKTDKDLKKELKRIKEANRGLREKLKAAKA